MSSTASMDRDRQGWFERAADILSNAIGSPIVFATALLVVVIWAASGPFVSFSNTWQLVINTGTTVVTFLMVFLLGNASNRMTQNQEAMLNNIYGQEEKVAGEERMIRKLVDRIDVRHIRPILQHLDQQDHQMQALEDRVVATLEGLRDLSA